MSDEKDDDFVSSEMKILIEGTDKTFLLKDREGIEHRLLPLNLKDILEFERFAKMSILDMVSTIKIEHIAFLVYLSLRKEGLSKEAIRKGEFKLSYDDIGEMFDCKFLISSGMVYLKLLEISGFSMTKSEVKGKPENPPVAAVTSGQ